MLNRLGCWMALATCVTVNSAGDPCIPNPCGSNAQCTPQGIRPVCSCQPGFYGNPLTYCQRGECAESSDCPGNRLCRDYRCVDVCAGQCGHNAECTARNHVPVCTCPPGHTGDPLTNCRPVNPQELCHPSPCGVNARCEVINSVPTCTCLPGFFGAPLTGCRHECESDYDCGSTQRCRDYKCENVCTAGSCGSNARCEPRNHRAVCTCPPGRFGDPYTGSCTAECESHYDCPEGRPACGAGKCIDPCAGVCGVNAQCRVRDRTTPVCSCPRDMTGDPFVSCRPFEKRDLCIPNPCGENAQCTPGHDNTGKERPVCTCPPGFLGNALVSCRRGECQTDSDCRSDQNCVQYNCRNSCEGQCGTGAECHARNHVAVCSCPQGYTGTPLSHCYPVAKPVAATRRGGRLYYLKK